MRYSRSAVLIIWLFQLPLTVFSSVNILTVIDAEFQNTRHLAALYARKREILKHFKAEIVEASVVEKHQFIESKRNSTSFGSSNATYLQSAISSAFLHRTAETSSQGSYSRTLDDLVIHRNTWQQDEFNAITCSKFLSFRLRGAGVSKKARAEGEKALPKFHVFMHGTKNGQIYFDDAVSKERLGVFETNQRVIERIEFLESDIPLILVQSENSTVMLYRLRWWQKKRVVVGDFVRRKKHEVKRFVCPRRTENVIDPRRFEYGKVVAQIQHAGDYDLLELSLESTIRSESGTTDQVMSMHMAYKHRKVIIALGMASGNLEFYERTGNLIYLHESSGTGGIYSMALPSFTILAYTAGKQVHFFNTMKMEKMEKVCFGTTKAIMSLHKDAFRGGVMYAGLSDGSVLALSMTLHRTRKTEYYTPPQGLNSSDPLLVSSACKVFKKLSPVRSPTLPTIPLVTTFPGYIFFSSGNLLVAYNATNLLNHDVKYLFEKEIGPNVVVSDLTSVKHSVASAFINIQYNTEKDSAPQIRKVVLLEALMAHEDSFYDISWIRGPLMVGGVMIVLGLQYYKKMNKQNQMGQPDFEEFSRKFNEWDRSHGGTGLPGMGPNPGSSSSSSSSSGFSARMNPGMSSHGEF